MSEGKFRAETSQFGESSTQEHNLEDRSGASSRGGLGNQTGACNDSKHPNVGNLGLVDVKNQKIRWGGKISKTIMWFVEQVPKRIEDFYEIARDIDEIIRFNDMLEFIDDLLFIFSDVPEIVRTRLNNAWIMLELLVYKQGFNLLRDAVVNHVFFRSGRNFKPVDKASDFIQYFSDLFLEDELLFATLEMMLVDATSEEPVSVGDELSLSKQDLLDLILLGMELGSSYMIHNIDEWNLYGHNEGLHCFVYKDHIIALTISGLNLEELPQSLSHFTQLIFLDLSYNRLKTLPNWFRVFKRLFWLYLNDNDFEKIPRILINLDHLNVLDMSNNSLREVDDWVKSLPNLENLNLANTMLSEFPTFLLESRTLSVLNLNYNSIKKIPGRLSENWSLSKLLLSGCGLDDIPDSIHSLKSLDFLEVEENNLEKFPLEAAKHRHLKHLFVSRNKFDKIPESFILSDSIEVIRLDKRVLENIDATLISSMELNKNMVFVLV